MPGQVFTPTPERMALLGQLRAMPSAMRVLPQWLLWRFETFDGDKKPRKVPYYVSGRKRAGGQGSDDDRQALASFDAALAALSASSRYDGLGFAFLPGDGLIGIDIDGAIDPDSGEVTERCRKIIAACASYTELSPSGKGVHIIAQGECTTFKDNSIGLEVFCGRQFFTCTGAAWEGMPAEVQPLPEPTLRRLVATVRAAKAAANEGKPVKPKPVAQTTQAGGVSDFERVNAAALALVDLWVPSMFPQAAKQATGAWRVRSRDLGRNLEEDLSLMPSGIRDFGTEEGLTPIDVVVRFGGKTPADALKWLASAIGMSLPKRTSKPKGAPVPATRAAQPDDGVGAPAKGRSTPASGSAREEGEADDWRNGLVRVKGGPADCRENVYLCLMNAKPLQGLVGYDEFAHRIVKLRTPPWDSTPGEWSTNDDYLLGLWLTRHERINIKAEGTLVAGVAMAAYEARFHPVHQYLAALPAWDGTERLAFWLSDCLGAEDTEYTRMVGAWFLMGMVKRVLEPGCQMDYMIVLEGKQGRRKSTALRALVGNDDWFADTPIRIGDKDAMLSLAGKWLYEVGELDSFNKAEVTAVKQYVSSRVDRVREPFARRPTDRPRSGVFAGSTNQNEYFKDPTGARRFWPVATGDVDVEKLAQWREQLFAEAMVRIRHEDPEQRRYYPTREETEQYLVPQQEQREIGDPWGERLAIWLESNQPYGDSTDRVREVNSFTTFDLLTKALGVPQDRIDGGRQMATRVGIFMHKLGWEKHRDESPPRVWRYWRPGTRKVGRGAAAGGPAVEKAEDLHEF